MKKQIKMAASWFMASAMAMTMLAGCGSSGSTTATAAGAETTAAAGTETTAGAETTAAAGAVTTAAGAETTAAAGAVTTAAGAETTAAAAVTTTAGAETTAAAASGTVSADELADPEDQIFRYSKGSDATGLNPIICTTAPDNEVFEKICEGLYRDVTNEKGESAQEPGAAESCDISDDGLTYTFHIRPDAVWSDGEPVTANDFEYTFKLMADPESGATAGWLYDGTIVNFNEAMYQTDGVKPDDIGVKALDDKTLEIQLVHPCSYFLESVSTAWPVRQDVYEKYGQSYGASVDQIVTNGGFRLTKWEPNVEMTYEKSENYWNADNVHLQTIECKIITDTATRAQAIISGDIDYLGTNEEEWVGVLSQTPGLTSFVSDGNNPEFFSFNCSNKYFKNWKVRLAFSLAIDREKFNTDLNDGTAEVMYGLMPACTQVGDRLYTEAVSEDTQIIKTLSAQYPDPKALLQEGLEEEGLDTDPSKMEVHLATRGTNEFSKRISEWMLQDWQENLGVTITIDSMEWNVMWDRVDSGDYDIATAGWGPYFNDPYGLLSIYDPENGYFNSSKTGWDDEDSQKFHELLDQSIDETDVSKRAEILFQAENILVGKAVIAPTYTATSNNFLSDKVGGYYVNPNSATDYNRIYIKKQ